MDAQAPGVARRVRDLSRVTYSGDGWIEQLLAQVSSLFLLLKVFERIETLPAATQADVRSAIGWTYKEEELPEENVVSDEWLVLGQRTTGDEVLRRAPYLAMESTQWEERARFGVCCSGPAPRIGSPAGNQDRSRVDILSEQLSAAGCSQEAHQHHAVAKRDAWVSNQRPVVDYLRGRACAQSVARSDPGATSDSCASASQ
jgi:hypothetical protein